MRRFASIATGAVALLLLCSVPAHAAIQGNPDSRPSLTMTGGFGETDSDNTRGWSAFFVLPMARNITLLAAYSGATRDLPSTFGGTGQLKSWTLQGGFRLYF